jgi:hypothetical protein
MAIRSHDVICDAVVIRLRLPVDAPTQSPSRYAWPSDTTILAFARRTCPGRQAGSPLRSINGASTPGSRSTRDNEDQLGEYGGSHEKATKKTGSKTVGGDYPLFRIHSLSRDQADNGEIKPLRRGKKGVIGWLQVSASGRHRPGQGAPMDLSAQLEKLQQQANETAASIRSASGESRDQLRQRIDQARVDANLALMDVKQQAEQTSDQVQTKWAQVKADASAWMDDIKAKIDKRADERDAKTAGKDADRAERDAADAIDYAVWAFFSAQLAVLDALDARAYADERAKLAGS